MEFTVDLGGFFNFGYTVLEGKYAGNTQPKGSQSMCNVILKCIPFPLCSQSQAIVFVLNECDL